jgi:hypothetical protein
MAAAWRDHGVCAPKSRSVLLLQRATDSGQPQCGTDRILALIDGAQTDRLGNPTIQLRQKQH